jgi:hypothetical protein
MCEGSFTNLVAAKLEALQHIEHVLRADFEHDPLHASVGRFDRKLSQQITTRTNFAQYCGELLDLLDRTGELARFGSYLIKHENRPSVRYRLIAVFGDLRPREQVDGACPYPGLLSFSPAEAGLFFGRDVEIDELADRVGRSRWLSIEGPSGVGKSSLMRAGLLPRLGRAWTVIGLRPGTHPQDSLADAVWGALPDAGRPARAHFHLDAQGLRDFVYERTRDGIGVLLVIDQLEEAVTFAVAEQARALGETLARILAEDALRCCLVTTIRSDQVERLGAALPALAGLLNHPRVTRYLVGPLTAEGLVDAVHWPATRRGLAFESGLVDTICAEALTDRGATPGGSLPLVAHFLRELWFTCVGGKAMTHAAYRELGGVVGALTCSAERTLEAVSELGEPALTRARRLLVALATVDDDGRATRRALTLAATMQLIDGDEALFACMSGGQDHPTGALMRLIVTSGSGAQARVDLIHETLLTRWTLLRGWLADAGPDKHRSEALLAAAIAWDQQGRTPDAFPGKLMREQHLAAHPDAEQTALQLDFQSALRAKLDQERRDKLWDRRKARLVITTLSMLVLVLAFQSGLAITRRWKLEATTEQLQGSLAKEETARTDLVKTLAEKQQALERETQLRVDKEVMIKKFSETITTLQTLAVDSPDAATRQTATHEVEKLQADITSIAADSTIVTRCKDQRAAIEAQGAATPRGALGTLVDCWARGDRVAAPHLRRALQSERAAFVQFLQTSATQAMQRELDTAIRRVDSRIAWRSELLRSTRDLPVQQFNPRIPGPARHGRVSGPAQPRDPPTSPSAGSARPP